MLSCRQAALALAAGGVVGYPTEAVYGLGCDPLDPMAFARLLALKGRALHKGVILIASDREQLAPYLAPMSPEQRAELDATWPGPVTWLIRAQPWVPRWLTGGRDTLAVRVTGHPLAAALCDEFAGPIVSTSANRSGSPPARTALRTRFLFGNRLDHIVAGPTGGRKQPSQIRDLASGALIRG